MNPELQGVKAKLDNLDGQRTKSGTKSEYRFDQAKSHLLTLQEYPAGVAMTLSIEHRPSNIDPWKYYPLIDIRFNAVTKEQLITVPTLVDDDQLDPRETVRNFYYVNGQLQPDTGPDPATGVFVDLEEVKQLKNSLEELGFVRAEVLPKQLDPDHLLRNFLDRITNPDLLNYTSQKQLLFQPPTT